jgi:hypothetical protein
MTKNASDSRSIGLPAPDIHFKGLIKSNYPEIETSLEFSYLPNEIVAGLKIFDFKPPKTYIPDAYFKSEKDMEFFIVFDGDLSFHSDRTNKYYMCKTAAYNSKLLRGNSSLIRFAYNGSSLLDENKLEEKYKFMDRIVLGIIKLLLISIPVLCLVKFGFRRRGKYGRIIYKDLPLNRHLLFNQETPKTHNEIFMSGKEEILKVVEEPTDLKIKWLIASSVDKGVNDNDLTKSINGGKNVLKIAIPTFIKPQDNNAKEDGLPSDREPEENRRMRFNKNGDLVISHEEYIYRGLKKIHEIKRKEGSDDELNTIEDFYNGLVKLYELITIETAADGHGGYWYGCREGVVNYAVGEWQITHKEATNFYDKLINILYETSDEYHNIKQWLINRHLWLIKDSLIRKDCFNESIVIKKVNQTIIYPKTSLRKFDPSNSPLPDEIQRVKDAFEADRCSFRDYEIAVAVFEGARVCEEKEYLEYVDNEGKERFINFDLICRLSLLYTVTPYQMKYFNSGKYRIREDITPDLSYYDPILNELGITKEWVITEFINNEYFFQSAREYGYV